MYELKDIKEVRKKFGLTQMQLAKKAGVSQSLIAKIEAGRLDPTYSNAQKIFRALDILTEKHEAKAIDIMTKKTISITPESDMQEVIKKIRGYGISQMPVIDNEKVIGFLSESAVVDALMAGKKDIKAKEIMQDCPPSVDKNATLTVISGLLKYYPMIMVMEKGKLLGVITKSDIIGSFTAKSRLRLW